MTRPAAYEIIEDCIHHVTIADVGDHAAQLTVTNDAERVVAKLHAEHSLGARRLFYYDSEGALDELLHDGACFTGFAPGPADVGVRIEKAPPVVRVRKPKLLTSRGDV